jgi:hypothetical protein
MKIIMASEVILKGLDPTRPHRALDSSGRLVAQPSTEVAQSTTLPFLPAPIQVEKAEQDMVETPEAVLLTKETLHDTKSPKDVAALDDAGDKKEDLAVSVGIPVDLDQSALESGPVASRPKGRPKGTPKKAP